MREDLGIVLEAFFFHDRHESPRITLRVRDIFGTPLESEPEEVAEVLEAIATVLRRPGHAETIATAAIRVAGEVWTLPRPARHHVLIQAWVHSHPHGKRKRIDEEQGFVTSTGRFVDRAEAERIARTARQLVGDIIGGELTSEDLW